MRCLVFEEIVEAFINIGLLHELCLGHSQSSELIFLRPPRVYCGHLAGANYRYRPRGVDGAMDSWICRLSPRVEKARSLSGQECFVSKVGSPLCDVVEPVQCL